MILVGPYNVTCTSAGAYYISWYDHGEQRERKLPVDLRKIFDLEVAESHFLQIKCAELYQEMIDSPVDWINQHGNFKTFIDLFFQGADIHPDDKKIPIAKRGRIYMDTPELELQAFIKDFNDIYHTAIDFKDMIFMLSFSPRPRTLDEEVEDGYA